MNENARDKSTGSRLRGGILDLRPRLNPETEDWTPDQIEAEEFQARQQALCAERIAEAIDRNTKEIKSVERAITILTDAPTESAKKGLRAVSDSIDNLRVSLHGESLGIAALKGTLSDAIRDGFTRLSSRLEARRASRAARAGERTAEQVKWQAEFEAWKSEFGRDARKAKADGCAVQQPPGIPGDIQPIEPWSRGESGSLELDGVLVDDDPRESLARDRAGEAMSAIADRVVDNIDVLARGLADRHGIGADDWERLLWDALKERAPEFHDPEANEDGESGPSDLHFAELKR